MNVKKEQRPCLKWKDTASGDYVMNPRGIKTKTPSKEGINEPELYGLPCRIWQYKGRQAILCDSLCRCKPYGR